MLMHAAVFHSTWDTTTRRQSLRSRHPLRKVSLRCVCTCLTDIEYYIILYNPVHSKFHILNGTLADSNENMDVKQKLSPF